MTGSLEGWARFFCRSRIVAGKQRMLQQHRYAFFMACVRISAGCPEMFEKYVDVISGIHHKAAPCGHLWTGWYGESVQLRQTVQDQAETI